MSAAEAPPVSLPRVVLICHDDAAIDSEGIAAWLNAGFVLCGIVLLQDRPGATWRKIRQEARRVGWWRILDVLLFRLLYRVRQSRKDAAWADAAVADLRRRYPGSLAGVPRLHAFDPNSTLVRNFIQGLAPDLGVARCKFILAPEIFGIPHHGTYVLHPGICPAYRNAHGCFWALANRDLQRVGMTLLKVDKGIDTGPVYLQSSYAFDETRESHVVIQHRVVLENLDAVGKVMHGISRCTAQPQVPDTMRSGNWGQPWLSAWLRWQRSANGSKQ